MNRKIIKIVLATFIMLIVGTLYGWSVLSKPIAQELTTVDQQAFSLVFTLGMGFFCIGGLIAGVLKLKGMGRIVVFIGGAMMGIGYYIASLATDISLLILGYGILVGLGVGFIYNYILSNVSPIIYGKQGLISGILLLGFGMSSMIIGTGYTRVIGMGYTWRTMFSVFAIVVFLLVILSGFVIEEFIPKSKTVEGKNISTKEMVKTKEFFIFFVWALLFTGIGLAIISQGANIIGITNRVKSPEMVAIIVGTISVFNGLGRVVVGYVFDKNGYFVAMMMVVSLFFVSVLMLILNQTINNVVILVVSFILIGLAYGGVPCINSAFISKVFGQKYFPTNLSLLNINILIASFASTIAGGDFVKSGNYFFTYTLCFAMVILGMGLTFILKKQIQTEEMD